MDRTKDLTVRNLNQDSLALLKHIRLAERRQLSAIIEEAIDLYWAEYFE